MIGSSNIILNIPHSSINSIFDKEIGGWNPEPAFINECVNEWTDWWTDMLFQSETPGIKSFVFPYSRFVCDVERLEKDPMENKGQGIIYSNFKDFHRATISNKNKEKLLSLRSLYLQSISKELNEKSILIDCHSFPSYLSETEICVGFNSDWSFNEGLVQTVENVCKKYGYKVSLNEPYSNSLTPSADFEYYSVMIEINKKIYMDENTLILRPDGCHRWKKCINQIYSAIRSNVY